MFQDKLITAPSTYLMEKSMPRLQGDGSDRSQKQSESPLQKSSQSGQARDYHQEKPAFGPHRKRTCKGLCEASCASVARDRKLQRIPKPLKTEPEYGVCKVDVPDTNATGTASYVLGSLRETNIETILDMSGVTPLTTVDTEGETIDQREVEGEVEVADTETSLLQQQVEDLQEQLNVQATVNADLKKLLVASMGDDLHCKVEALSRSKNQLASEIGGYSNRILEDYEHLDKLAIQADMWRSKYLASKMLCEQLGAAQQACAQYVADSRSAVQRLLMELQQVRDDAGTVYQQLLQLRDAFDPLAAKSVAGRTHGPINVLDLSRLNTQVCGAVRSRLLGAVPLPEGSDVTRTNSPGETLAFKMLNSETQSLVARVQNLPAPEAPVIERWHPLVRFENITYNCCAKCKGDLIVV